MILNFFLYKNKGTNCDCMIGWLDTGSENCEECYYTCESCTGDVNTCATCMDSENRKIGTNCECKFGWLDTGIEEC